MIIDAIPKLRKNWENEPPGPAAMQIGTKWVREQRSAVLQVPSALIPPEANYLLNPTHLDFRKRAIRGPRPFLFDPRMWS